MVAWASQKYAKLASLTGQPCLMMAAYVSVATLVHGLFRHAHQLEFNLGPPAGV